MAPDPHPRLPARCRLPRGGIGFALLRVAGHTFEIGGALIAVVALLGFIAVLVTGGPSLLSAMSHLEQRMAWLVVAGTCVWLVVPVAAGFCAVFIAVLGFLSVDVGTRPAEESEASGASHRDGLSARCDGSSGAPFDPGGRIVLLFRSLPPHTADSPLLLSDVAACALTAEFHLGPSRLDPIDPGSLADARSAGPARAHAAGSQMPLLR